jgi:hypothetical protein
MLRARVGTTISLSIPNLQTRRQRSLLGSNLLHSHGLCEWLEAPSTCEIWPGR